MNVEPPPSVLNVTFEEYQAYIKLPGAKDFIAEVDDRYFYWSEFKYRPNIPAGSAKDAWAYVKYHRRLRQEGLRLGRHRLSYVITKAMQAQMYEFDVRIFGRADMHVSDVEARYGDDKESFVLEAISSSQVEGAATTTDLARTMLASGRRAKNESEQMILNNYHAIRAILERADEPLSKALIIHIHELMTRKTSAEKYAGSFRDHAVYVTDHVTGDTAYTAPDHEEVEAMMADLVAFVNDDSSFLHPIVKAAIIHFAMGYIHPFGDGNGRTARALFYWYMIKRGYDLLRHISISKTILQTRVSYDKAFLHVEYDGLDMTYFIRYTMKNLDRAFADLVADREQRRQRHARLHDARLSLIRSGHTDRHADALAYMLVESAAGLSVSAYASRYDIVRQTASRDLEALLAQGLVLKTKRGRHVVYHLAVGEEELMVEEGR